MGRILWNEMYQEADKLLQPKRKTQLKNTTGRTEPGWATNGRDCSPIVESKVIIMDEPMMP